MHKLSVRGAVKVRLSTFSARRRRTICATMSAEELVPFLNDKRADVREQAAEAIAGYSAGDEADALLKCSLLEPSLLKLLSDTEPASLAAGNIKFL